MRNSNDVATMLCPVCRTGFPLSDRSGVEIDYCPQCRGVWLDRGELDKIIAYSESAAAPPRERSREYDRDRGSDSDHFYRGDRYSHGRKKKSFLSELFD